MSDSSVFASVPSVAALLTRVGFDTDNQWRSRGQEWVALFPLGSKLPFSTGNQNYSGPALALS